MTDVLALFHAQVIECLCEIKTSMFTSSQLVSDPCRCWLNNEHRKPTPLSTFIHAQTMSNGMQRTRVTTTAHACL